MKFFYQLYQLGFLNPKRVFLLLQAKRKHGSNICFLLKLSATYFKDRIALSDGKQAIVYQDLYKRVLSATIAIKKIISTEEKCLGVLLCANSIEHIITCFAIQNAGIDLVLINHKTPAPQTKALLDGQDRPCYLFASQEQAISYDETIVIDNLGDNKLSIIGKVPFSKKHKSIIFTTSGTTGVAKFIKKRKGVMYWMHSFVDLIIYTGIYKKKTVFISTPISHGFGFTALLFSIILGKKAVVANNKKWPEQIDILTNEKVDFITGVPTSLYYLAENLKGKNHSVDLVVSGGAALTDKVFKSIENVFGKNIFSLYGSTEASTSFIANHNHLQANSCALGRPLKKVKYKLAFQNASTAELLIQSKLGNIKTTTGWVGTGDLVKQNENGLLIWCGRKDDMIIKNGVNIYPIEIERELLAIPEIEDVYVAKEIDSIKGDSITAYIQLTRNKSLNDAEIKNILNEYLPVIKIPDRIVFVNEFYFTNTGKKINPALI